MGRAQKIGFDYFPMNVEAGQDPKIFYLMEIGGPSAVCCWLFLLMEIYKSGGWIRWGRVETLWFSRRYGLSVEQVEGGIKAMASSNLLSKRALALDILTSKGIQDRIKEMSVIAKRIPPAFPQGVEITSEDIDTPLGIDQNKGKEIKLKESKVKEIGGNPEKLGNPPEKSEEIGGNPEESLATAQAPAPKVKSEVLSTSGKTLRAKYVWLSDIELEQFTVTHGPEFIKRCIEKLDAWIETDPVPKRIKNGRNAGACFRSWVFNSVAEEQSRASRGKAQIGFKPHTAATTVEKNLEYFKDTYGQTFVDEMLATPLFGEKELDYEPAGGKSVAVLPARTTK